MEQGHFPTDGFADVLGANKEYVANFKYFITHDILCLVKNSKIVLGSYTSKTANF